MWCLHVVSFLVASRQSDLWCAGQGPRKHVSWESGKTMSPLRIQPWRPHSVTATTLYLVEGHHVSEERGVGLKALQRAHERICRPDFKPSQTCAGNSSHLSFKGDVCHHFILVLKATFTGKSSEVTIYFSTFKYTVPGAPCLLLLTGSQSSFLFLFPVRWQVFSSTCLRGFYNIVIFSSFTGMD